MALTDILEKVERTIYEALRLTCVREGYTPNIKNFDIENPNASIAKAASIAYETALNNIRNTKGFSIDLFNYAPSQSRGLKKVPRIVLQTEALLPGNTGLDTTPEYVYDVNSGKYISKQSQTLTSDYYFNIHLVSSNTQETRVLHGIMLATLPRMGYIKWYTDNELRLSHNLLIKYLSYSESDFLAEGIIEKIYRYYIPDVHEIDSIITELNISPIKEITLDIEGKDFNEQLIIKK